MRASLPRSSPTELEQTIGYSFRNSDLLLQALTHRTFSHEHPEAAPLFNERLEFLGDAVLGLVISEELFGRYPDLNEGVLSKLKAALVRERTLASVARSLNLGDSLRLGRGEEQTGGREKRSLLADAVEALIAAVFLDGGLGAARALIGRFFEGRIEEAAEAGRSFDAKTTLQELAYRLSGQQPEYRLTGESGPDHLKTFAVEVLLQKKVLGQGSGRNKKEAEQAAARAALKRLEPALPAG